MSGALTDVLRLIRMESSVFSRAHLEAPFGVESGEMPSGIFHAVTQGNPWVQLSETGEATRLGPGDIVLFPFGDNHLITDSAQSPYQPIGLLTSVDENGMGQLVVEGGGPQTALICGSVNFDHKLAEPILSALPPMVIIHDLSGEAWESIETLITRIANEVDNPSPGSEIVIARLTDALVVYVLRAYIEQLEAGEGGWLGALKDPPIRAALDMIHSDPSFRWTGSGLAHAVGMSRSSFFGRFRDVVGMTPADYITRWRIQLATDLLRDRSISVAAAGREVGYATEAAFSNAFLRVMGVRPGAYRRAA